MEKDTPEYVIDASKINEFVNLSKKEQEVLSKIEKAKADRDAQMVYQWVKGKEEGRQEGREETLVGIARRMLERGKSIEEIEEMTGLSIDVIQTLNGKKEL